MCGKAVDFSSLAAFKRSIQLVNFNELLSVYKFAVPTALCLVAYVSFVSVSIAYFCVLLYFFLLLCFLFISTVSCSTWLSGRRLPSCRPRSSWLTVSCQDDAGHSSYDDVTGRQSIILPSPDRVSGTAVLLPSVIRHCRRQSSESC